MKVQPTDNINFRIYKGTKIRSYGQYHWGEYKGNKIEIFDAYKENQKLIYVSDNLKKFVKSKLIYWLDGIKRVMRAERK